MSEQVSSSASNQYATKIAVVGGGISGLTAAYSLLRFAEERGLSFDITLFEPRTNLGGVIQTVRQDDVVMDLGPECFVSSKPAVLDLAEDLGIESRIICQSNRKTYISKGAELHSLPEGLSKEQITSFASSNLISMPGKLRMALEALISRSNHSSDESVADFISRRFGHECLEQLAEPLIGGLYGSDPEMLSARSTIPTLVALEQAYGSVLVGMLKKMRKQSATQPPAAAKMSMSSFDQGMIVLVEQLKSYLERRCTFISKEVTSIEQGKYGRAWDVYWLNGLKQVDAVVVAAPASKAAPIVLKVDRFLAMTLHSIKYSSPIVVNLIYDRELVRHSLDGSGFLVPRNERRTIRACTFSSSKFRHRSTPDKALIRVSLNTLRIPGLNDLSDRDVAAVVANDLSGYLGISKQPMSVVVTRHQTAIPQFAPGHDAIVREIERRISKLDNFALVGNAYAGMGVSDCVARAQKEAARLADSLSSIPTATLQ